MSQNKKDRSKKVVQKDKASFPIHINERNDLTEKQLAFLELVEDKGTKLVLFDAPAGTSKTFLSVLSALRAIKSKKVSHLVYVRTIIESASKSIGALPGLIEEKLNPFLLPLRDKLDELVPKDVADSLIKDGRIESIPINFLRGANFNATFLILDEAQNATFSELTTVITRQGEYSKFILCGDSGQSDLIGKSGFPEMYSLFDNEKARENGIFCVKFDSSDIVRSGIVRFIVEALDEYNKTRAKK